MNKGFFFLCFIILASQTTGCQIDYYLKSGYGQAILLKNQKPIQEVLEQLPSEKKRKILLILNAKDFAEKDLGLSPSENYTSYVELNRRFVTYIVQVAEPFKLQYHYWHFPFIGSIPYKGFFDQGDAQAEAKIYDDQGFDTFVRGVRAFSTLGWFRDPILSSMLDYDDDDLVNLIIHETTHSTLYIKNNADFNEQLATFVGNKGTELFYIKREGESSPMLELIKKKNLDENLFSQFITKELSNLETWYRDHPKANKDSKVARLKELQDRFGQLKFGTHTFDYFKKISLNNAVLLGYKTYMNDLSSFELLFKKKGSMKDFLQEVKALEKSDDPKQDLVRLNTQDDTSEHRVYQ